MKRPLIIILIIVLVLLVAGAVYYFFFMPRGGGITVDTGGNPFETGGDYTGGRGEQEPVGDMGTSGEEVAPNLIRITEGPVAYGAIVFLTPKTITEEASSTATSSVKQKTIQVPEVRYVERQSGNVYRYEVNERLLTRISNRTLPGIQEVAWSGGGKVAFLRFLSKRDGADDIVDTYALPTEGEGGYALESGLSDVVTVGTSSVITLLPSSTGSIATIARTDGANAKTFFTSSLSSLRILPAGKGLVAYTKASSQSEGFGFTVSSSGVFDRILGPYRGLTLLPSSSGKQVAYSYLTGQSVTAGILDVEKRTTTTLPIALLPEKCVWAKDELSVYCAVPRTMSGTWPDSWYQGTVSFSDRIWKIDLASRTAILIVDPLVVADVAIDAVSLSLDDASDVLLFTNKKDGSLWAYDL